MVVDKLGLVQMLQRSHGLLEGGKAALKVAVRSLGVHGERLAVHLAQPVFVQPLAKAGDHAAPVLRILHNVSDGESVWVLVVFPRLCPFVLRDRGLEQFVDIVIHLSSSLKRDGRLLVSRPSLNIAAYCFRLCHALRASSSKIGDKAASGKIRSCSIGIWAGMRCPAA